MYRAMGLNTFAKSVYTSFMIMVTVLVFHVNPRVADAQQLPSPPPYQQLRYDEITAIFVIQPVARILGHHQICSIQ